MKFVTGARGVHRRRRFCILSSMVADRSSPSCCPWPATGSQPGGAGRLDVGDAHCHPV